MRLRAVITGLITGLLFVGSVWAGTGLAPVKDAASERVPPTRQITAASSVDDQIPAECASLSGDEVCAGAAAISLRPAPDAGAGEYWEQDADKCVSLAFSEEALDVTLEWAADTRSPWAENPNCIYMGGYGIGPMNPVTSWDEVNGLWARSFAMVRNGKELVLTILDAEGYFAEYGRLCGGTCGTDQLGADLAAELGIDPNAFIMASTHSHTALDLIGGWGAVPEWYMEQVAEAITESARQALVNATPALLEGGEVIARRFNSQRRDTYRSAEDPSLNWLRAYDDEGAIFTIGTYAAHPVSQDEATGMADADFPVIFAKEAERLFGGTAGIFQAGLGNMSPRGGAVGQGLGLANLLPAIGAGTPVTTPDIRVGRTYWDQPVTNVPLGLLGAGSFFDRPFGGPATVNVGTSRYRRCVSASAVSARVSVTAAKVGDVIVTAAPGEVFANYTNTIEESPSIPEARRITALAIAQANDALGYMPQSFEDDDTAREGTGFLPGLDQTDTLDGAFEYEDAYAIDKCFGDMALESTLALLSSL